jgi:hypothetical protein
MFLSVESMTTGLLALALFIITVSILFWVAVDDEEPSDCDCIGGTIYGSIFEFGIRGYKLVDFDPSQR